MDEGQEQTKGMNIMKCNVCTGEFDLDGEGGITGDIGILPVAFCPTCFAGVSDMCEQLGNLSDEQPYKDEQKKDYTMTGLTSEEVDICQEALAQADKGEAKMKYWIESSFNFEDPTKEYEEYWAVGVSRGEEKETETIASFTMSGGSLKEELDDLIKSINNEQ